MRDTRVHVPLLSSVPKIEISLGGHQVTGCNKEPWQSHDNTTSMSSISPTPIYSPQPPKALHLSLGRLFDKMPLATNVTVLSRRRRHHECVIRKNPLRETYCNYQAFTEQDRQDGTSYLQKNRCVNCAMRTCWSVSDRILCLEHFHFTNFDGPSWPYSATRSRSRANFINRV